MSEYKDWEGHENEKRKFEREQWAHMRMGFRIDQERWPRLIEFDNASLAANRSVAIANEDALARRSREEIRNAIAAISWFIIAMCAVKWAFFP